MSTFTGGDECGQEDDSLAEQLLPELGCNHNDPSSDHPTSTCLVVPAGAPASVVRGFAGRSLQLLR